MGFSRGASEVTITKVPAQNLCISKKAHGVVWLCLLGIEALDFKMNLRNRMFARLRAEGLWAFGSWVDFKSGLG